MTIQQTLNNGYQYWIWRLKSSNSAAWLKDRAIRKEWRPIVWFCWSLQTRPMNSGCKSMWRSRSTSHWQCVRSPMSASSMSSHNILFPLLEHEHRRDTKKVHLMYLDKIIVEQWCVVSVRSGCLKEKKLVNSFIGWMMSIGQSCEFKLHILLFILFIVIVTREWGTGGFISVFFKLFCKRSRWILWERQIVREVEGGKGQKK